MDRVSSHKLHVPNPPRQKLYEQSTSMPETHTASNQVVPYTSRIPYLAMDSPVYPRLRRKPSTIGKASGIRTSPLAVHDLPSSMSSRIGSALDANRTGRGPLTYVPPTLLARPQHSSTPDAHSSTGIHPAYREHTKEENFQSSPPLSYTPSVTPSTIFTASPAISQVSSRTSSSSYSPNMPPNIFGVHMPGRDARRAPPLPSSPKAYKDNRASQAQRPSPDARIFRPIPPELAHLNVDSASVSRPCKPITSIHDNMACSPTTKADLTGDPISDAEQHTRIRSPDPLLSTGLRNAPGRGAASASRAEAHRRDSGTATLEPTRDELNSFKSVNDTHEAGVVTFPSPSTDSPNRPGSAGRLGRFFGRGNDHTRESNDLRKGPAAGTGHEGYGKFGFRGRSLSLSSLMRGRSQSRSRSRSRSADSNASVLTGPTSEIPIDPSNKHENTNECLAPPELAVHDRGTISTCEAKDANNKYAFFRSKSAGIIRPLVSQVQQSPVQILSSFETTSYIGMNQGIEREGQILQSQGMTDHSGRHSRPQSRLRLRSRSRSQSVSDQIPEIPRKSSKRWNFLRRTQEPQPEPDLVITTSTSPVSNKQKLGFYAISPANSSIGLDEIHNAVFRSSILQSSQNLEIMSFATEPARLEERHRSLKLRPSHSTTVSSTASDQNLRSGSPQSVIVESSNMKQVPTVANFTRPSAMSLGTGHSTRRIACEKGCYHPLDIATIPLGSSPRSALSYRDAQQPENCKPFLGLPAQHNTRLSCTSSSDATSIQSDMTLIGNVLPTTWLGDEDIWNEYNDLLDEVIPADYIAKRSQQCKITSSEGSSCDNLFQYDEHDRSTQSGSRVVSEVNDHVKDAVASPFQSDITPSSTPDRLSHFLQPVTTPSTPYSLSDIISGYGNRSGSFASTVAYKSTAYSRRSIESGYSSRYSTMSDLSRPMSKSDVEGVSAAVRDQRNSRDPTRAREATGTRHSCNADLRFGALITSKWLSFGRVMFSPAHNEMKTATEARVLVIDGLGKDWSYYCALTYPSATIYNLEITTAGASSVSRGRNLTNYKNIRHAAIGSSFPFPQGFFTAVVFRFPTAATDKGYQSCMSECSRVLRPGGYLEISTLDLDMMNMKTKARRALRGLKMAIHSRNESISLHTASDMMITLVGQCGYENIQRCIVGLPVADRTSSRGVESGIGSGRSSIRAAISRHDRGERINTSDFSGILGDSQDRLTTKACETDEDITNMIARVGRWWYSTCYENAAGLDSRIWDDEGLLGECEEQGTAFRLMLCYAQKPNCLPRRTASV